MPFDLGKNPAVSAAESIVHNAYQQIVRTEVRRDLAKLVCRVTGVTAIASGGVSLVMTGSEHLQELQRFAAGFGGFAAIVSAAAGLGLVVSYFRDRYP